MVTCRRAGVRLLLAPFAGAQLCVRAAAVFCREYAVLGHGPLESGLRRAQLIVPVALALVLVEMVTFVEQRQVRAPRVLGDRERDAPGAARLLGLTFRRARLRARRDCLLPRGGAGDHSTVLTG